jgi:hypothetical protein
LPFQHECSESSQFRMRYARTQTETATPVRRALWHSTGVMATWRTDDDREHQPRSDAGGDRLSDVFFS